ncbi:phage tail tip lysozyme [Methylobacterium komagatae]
MATQVLKEFLVAIGFKVDSVSFNKQSETIANYEKSIIQAEKKVDEARLKSAKNLEQRNKIEAELHLKALKRGLEEAKATEENQKRQALAIAGTAATVAVAVAAAMAAIGNAVRNTIGEFDRLSYISARTGASVGNIKAIGYAFSQTGSSAEAAVQALENFGRARRANPGVDGLLRSYGVSTEGDSSEVLSNALDAITKRHPQYTAQQVAGLIGISPDEVDHWIRYRKEIAEFNKQYKDLQRSFGVNGGEMARASTSISRAMGEFSAVIEVLKNKLVSFFLPAIEAVAKGMTDLLHILTNEENVAAFASYFDKPIAAVKEMVRWVKALYDQFVVLFEYVRNSPIGKLLGGINPGYFREKFLDFITPSSASASEAFGGGGSGGGPGLFRRGANAVSRLFGGDPGDMSGGRASRQKGENVAGAKESYDFWRSKGLTHAQSAGLVGMEEGESNFNPRAIGDGGAAHGAFQHHPDRRAKIFRGTGIDIDRASHREQLEAAYWEMTKGDEKAAWAAVKRADSPGGSAAAGVYKFERPLDKAGEAARRGARANYWAEKFKDSANPSVPRPAESKPSAPAQPRLNMSPVSFNVDDYLKSRPMGSTSTSNDNSRKVSQNNPVTVNVHGATDPQAAGAAAGRAVSQANDMSLRNVQTAIR